MRTSWGGRNIDLALLSVYVEDFLKNNGFGVRKIVSSKECTVLETRKRPRSFHMDVTVKIIGDSNDFVIEFLAGERVRSSVRWSLLATAFGGGSFLLRALKSQEALQKLEKEFWVYNEETVNRLTGSALART